MSSTGRTTSSAAGSAGTAGNKLLEALIREAQQAQDWILIAPNGRMYVTNKPEELFAVLAPHHPLLKGLP